MVHECRRHAHALHAMHALPPLAWPEALNSSMRCDEQEQPMVWYGYGA
jgi:hypothetical protein